MKKIILFIIFFLTLTGCSNTKENISNNTNNNISNETQEENIPTEEQYIDDNPITVSLYNNKNKITTYNAKIRNATDIASFDVYYTDINTVESTQTKINYQKYFQNYQNIDKYKNGFYIEFEADNKKIEQLILDPTAQYAMYPYMYIYLYDDINQKPYTYYSHLKTEEMNENTIISSIKLYSAEEGEKITSPIYLTVFTYDNEDDFTEDNKYRGISKYTIEIKTN